jgi:hypothetical protein
VYRRTDWISLGWSVAFAEERATIYACTRLCCTCANRVRRVLTWLQIPSKPHSSLSTYQLRVQVDHRHTTPARLYVCRCLSLIETSERLNFRIVEHLGMRLDAQICYLVYSMPLSLFFGAHATTPSVHTHRSRSRPSRPRSWSTWASKCNC